MAGLNKNILYTTVVMLLLVFLAPVSHAGKVADYSSAVWFDSTGLFHSGDLLKYLNDVHSGSIKDHQIAKAISAVRKPGKTIKTRHVEKIARQLDPLKHTAAIYTVSSEDMSEHTKTVSEYFANPVGKPGTLDLLYYAIQLQGDAYSISGISDTNIMLALPADPRIASKLSLEIGQEGVPNLQSVMFAAVEHPKWNAMARHAIPPVTGKLKIGGLHPGPWIVFLNQHDCMNFCYRIQILPGKTTKITVTEPLWRVVLGK